MRGEMRMTAKNVASFFVPCVRESSLRNQCRCPHIVLCVALQKSTEPSRRVQLGNCVYPGRKLGKPPISLVKRIKLIPVNRKMPLPSVFPYIFVIYNHIFSVKPLENLRDIRIVVTRNPNNLTAIFRLHKPANVAKNIEFFFFETLRGLMTVKNVAVKNKATKREPLKNLKKRPRLTQFRSKVNVAHNQGVNDFALHRMLRSARFKEPKTS